MIQIVFLLLPLLLAVPPVRGYKIERQESCDPHYQSCTPHYIADPHPCARPCRSGESMTCYYHMEAEWYSVLGKACYMCPLNITDCSRPFCIAGDGIERGIMTINREFPGHTISVCRGDKVVVDFTNKLPSETTTMHWHGQYMHGDIEGEGEEYRGKRSVQDEGYNSFNTFSNGGGWGEPTAAWTEKRSTPVNKVQNPTPWSDGVPGLTQCPILPGQTFRYKFIANPAGTHWYHAHAAFQREDGLAGPLIVRVPDEDNVHRDLYDADLDEHVLIFQDWVHKIGIDMFIPHHWDDGTNKADSFIVNGKGRFKNFGLNEVPGIYTPVHSLSVKPGKRYRLRLINSGASMCPVEVSIEDHEFTVIASDGIDIKPVKADSLVMHNGERFDIVLDTAGHDIKTYKIKFGGLFDCKVNGNHGTALLEYEGATDQDKVFSKGATKYQHYVNIPGRQVNSLNVNSGYDVNKTIISDLRSAVERELTPKKADRTIYLAYTFNDLNHSEFHDAEFYSFADVIGKNALRTPQINNITMKAPMSPLLTQYEETDPKMVCNSETLDKEKHCKDGFCACYHVEKVAIGDVVDLFLIDEGLPWDVNHPWHLHGMHFQVLAMERFAEKPDHIFGMSPPGNDITRQFIVDRDKAGKIPRNYNSPPLKDTVLVPDSGYTLIRFRADNPGVWFMHCHMAWHNHVGMGLVIQIGEPDEWPKPPKNFQKCSNFMS